MTATDLRKNRRLLDGLEHADEIAGLATDSGVSLHWIGIDPDNGEVVVDVVNPLAAAGLARVLGLPAPKRHLLGARTCRGTRRGLPVVLRSYRPVWRPW